MNNRWSIGSRGSVLSLWPSQATRALLARRPDGKLPTGLVVALSALSVAAVAGHLWFWRHRR